MRVGEHWQLIDLDASCKIGNSFGSKPPSTGYCPPEMAKVLLEAEKDMSQLRNYRADLAYDLWSFGAVLFQLLTGYNLWDSRQGTDDILESQLEELASWDEDACITRLGKVGLSDNGIDPEAHQLLLQLLDSDPVARLRHFGGKMENVLKTEFFTGARQGLSPAKACKERVEEMHDMLRSPLGKDGFPDGGFLINWGRTQDRRAVATIEKKADDALLENYENHITKIILENTRKDMEKACRRVEELREGSSEPPTNKQEQKLADANGKAELLQEAVKLLSYLAHLAKLLRVVRNHSSHYIVVNENSPSLPLNRRHARIVMHSYANFFQCLLRLDRLGNYPTVTGSVPKEQLRKWSQRCWEILNEQCRQDEDGMKEMMATDPLQFHHVAGGLPSAPQLRDMASKYMKDSGGVEPSLLDGSSVKWLEDLKNHLEPKSKTSQTFLDPKWAYLLVTELLEGLSGRLPAFAWATQQTDGGSSVSPRKDDLACRLAMFLGKHTANVRPPDHVHVSIQHLRLLCSLCEHEVVELHDMRNVNNNEFRRSAGLKRGFGQLVL